MRVQSSSLNWSGARRDDLPEQDVYATSLHREPRTRWNPSEPARPYDATDFDTDRAHQILASAQLKIANADRHPALVESSQLGDDLGLAPSLGGRRIRQVGGDAGAVDATEVMQEHVVESAWDLIRCQRRAGRARQLDQLGERGSLA